MLITLFSISWKALLQETVFKCLNVLCTWSSCTVSRQLRARSVGSSLPSSQGPASQKVGHLVTFQSSSGRGTHSLHIILLLLFPPRAPSPAPPNSPPLPLCISPLPHFKDQKPSWSSVRSPEVDHFNSASQIFFKKTPDPETSEPVTVGWTRAVQPGPGRL